jgi:hypothetical protein
MDFSREKNNIPFKNFFPKIASRKFAGTIVLFEKKPSAPSTTPPKRCRRRTCLALRGTAVC